MTQVGLVRLPLVLLGAAALTGAMMAPASAETDDGSNGEILEVSYPEGPLSFTGLMPGDDADGQAVVTNTSDIDVEVLVTTEWSGTEAAAAGVVLTGEICEGTRQGDECVGETVEFTFDEDICTLGVMAAQQYWDIRLVATLPPGVGNDAQDVSSPFAVNFAVASEVYEEITGENPGEPVATDCPSPDAGAVPDPEDDDEPTVTAPPTPDATEKPVATQTPSPTDAATEAPDQPDTDAPDESTAEAADESDDGLAVTGANIWTAAILGLVMILIGSMLVTNHQRTQRGQA